jgi:transcriptional regulator with XRE-family HTH domain
VEALAAERVTLRGIARLLGVSHATVSLALRGSPRISVARRSEVLQVAERLGYRPDPMLSALRHYRRTVGRPSIQAEIAWLNFWPQPGRLRSFREFDGYWRGALAMAEAQGYRLEEFRVNSQLSIDRLRAILRARNIKGLLLPPVPATCHLSMDTLAWAEHSVVCFGHSHSGLRGMPVVTVDQAAAAALAFRKIRERGYHRVGLVTSLETVRRTRFAAGYLQSQLFVPEAERLPLLALSEENSEQTPVVSATPTGCDSDRCGLLGRATRVGGVARADGRGPGSVVGLGWRRRRGHRSERGGSGTDRSRGADCSTAVFHTRYTRFLPADLRRTSLG